MVEVPTELAAAERAQWLAELSQALDEAGGLMKLLGASEGRIDAVELYTRIEALRFEIQALRLGRFTRSGDKLDPEWTEFTPWRHSGGGAA